MNIFQFFKKTSAEIYFAEAEQYCSSNYVPPAAKVSELQVKYSICIPEEDFSEPSDYIDISVPSRKYSINTEDLLRSLKSGLAKTIEGTFVDKLREHIQEKHLRESSVYKAAQIDRRLFSKITKNRHYNPSKDTCIALAFALKLGAEEFLDLLSRAGYTLSHSNRRDVIIEFVVHKEIYDVNTVNEILYHMGEKTLGR